MGIILILSYPQSFICQLVELKTGSAPQYTSNVPYFDLQPATYPSRWVANRFPRSQSTKLPTHSIARTYRSPN